MFPFHLLHPDGAGDTLCEYSVFLIFLLYGPDILPSMDDVWDYMFNIYYSDFFKEKSTFIKVVPFITLGLYGISYAITILSVKSRFSRKEI